MSDYREMTEALDKERVRLNLERLTLVEDDLRAEVRDAPHDLQRQLADVFAALRVWITGEVKPHVSTVGKSGPAFEVIRGGKP